MVTNEEIDHCVSEAILMGYDVLHQDLYGARIQVYRAAVLFIIEGPPPSTLRNAVDRMIAENLVPDLAKKYEEFRSKQSPIARILRELILFIDNPSLTKLIL